MKSNKLTYKGFVCKWNEERSAFEIFTADEWSCGEGCRYPEMECETKAQCKEFIDSY